MKLSMLMALKALVCLVVGVALVLIPDTSMSWFGINLDAGGIYVGRMFGAAFLILAILLWTVKDVSSEAAQNDIVLAVFIGDTVGLVVALIGQLSNAVNSLDWLTIVVYFLLFFGFGYFLVQRRINPLKLLQRPSGS